LARGPARQANEPITFENSKLKTVFACKCCNEFSCSLRESPCIVLYNIYSTAELHNAPLHS